MACEAQVLIHLDDVPQPRGGLCALLSRLDVCLNDGVAVAVVLRLAVGAQKAAVGQGLQLSLQFWVDSPAVE
eukprot:15100318-Heterocapsa_arctica.AAC.1